MHYWWRTYLNIFTVLFVAVALPSSSHAFSMSSSSSKEIYGVKGSGWTSPEWNWGYAQGTGHTCAAICRDLYGTRQAREKLVENLLAGKKTQNEPSVEEIKLILALEWQRGRWDGSDGGKGGYGEVLSRMAAAKRYEAGSHDVCLQRLVEDMADPNRFSLLGATKEEVQEMESCLLCGNPEDGFRRSAGMVLSAMGFIERGM